MQNPSVLATRATRKPLDLGSATRNATPQAPCTELHGRYRRPKELARNAKNPGKTFGFAAERTGTELLGVFSNVLGKFDRCDISRIGREGDPFESDWN